MPLTRNLCMLSTNLLVSFLIKRAELAARLVGNYGSPTVKIGETHTVRVIRGQTISKGTGHNQHG